MISDFTIEIIAGVLLAFATILFWRVFIHYERLLSGLALVCAGGFYPIFGLLAGAPLIAMPWEIAGFLLACVFGFFGVRSSMWYLAVGWMLHGPWDVIVPHLEDVSHMPSWYAGLCLGFDVVAGSYWAARAMGWFPGKAEALKLK